MRENQLQGRLSPPPLTSPSHFVVDGGDDVYDVVVDNGDDSDKDDGDDDGGEEEMIALTICRSSLSQGKDPATKSDEFLEKIH